MCHVDQFTFHNQELLKSVSNLNRLREAIREEVLGFRLTFYSIINSAT